MLELHKICYNEVSMTVSLWPRILHQAGVFKVEQLNSIFIARQHSLLCRLQSAVLAMIGSVWPSDRPVRHTLVSCQNYSSYDHGVFTGG